VRTWDFPCAHPMKMMFLTAFLVAGNVATTRAMDFHDKVTKVDDILAEMGIRHRKLTKNEVDEYCHRFMAFQFRRGAFSMTNFKASDECLRIGDRVVRSFPLVDIDEINLPSVVKPYTQTSVNGYQIATDLLSFLTNMLFADCVVYNQVVQIHTKKSDGTP